MTHDKAQMIALADRLEVLSGHSGKELGCLLYRTGDDPDTASEDVRVLLVSVERRAMIVDALRFMAKEIT